MFSHASDTYPTLDLCRHTKKKQTLITRDGIIDVEWDHCPFQRQLTQRTYFIVTQSHMERHFVYLKWKRDFDIPEGEFPPDDGKSDPGSGSDGDDFGPDVTGSGSDSDSDCEEEEAVEIYVVSTSEHTMYI